MQAFTQCPGQQRQQLGGQADGQPLLTEARSGQKACNRETGGRMLHGSDLSRDGHAAK